jgi:hypothetical protein
MSSDERDKVRELAGRVARKLADAPGPAGGVPADASGDLSSLRSALGEIQRRLTHIESHLTHGEDCGHESAKSEETDGRHHAPAQARGQSAQAGQTPSRSMWLSGTYVPAVSHPSQERFTNVGEAVSELVEFFESEKTCTVEPGAKPCDHCGVCSSRGF